MLGSRIGDKKNYYRKGVFMGQLADLARQRSPFLRLEANESVIGKYKGFKMVPSTFDVDKENFRFLIETAYGIKYWDTGSNKVAMVFDECKEGDAVKITKTVTVGKNGKEMTSWTVEKTKEKMPSPVEVEKPVDDREVE